MSRHAGHVVNEKPDSNSYTLYLAIGETAYRAEETNEKTNLRRTYTA